MVTRLVLVVALVAVPLTAQEPKTLTEAQQLKARIVLLEAENAALKRDAAICGARLALAGQPQSDAATKKAMADLEQDAGCALDWAKTPVTCRAVPKEY